jgi:hypothetical protein
VASAGSARPLARDRRSPGEVDRLDPFVPRRIGQAGDGGFGKRVVDDRVDEHQAGNTVAGAQREQLGDPAADVVADDENVTQALLLEQAG